VPSKTKRQRRFMGAELSRKRSGKKTITGMSERQLKDFASKKKKKVKRKNCLSPIPFLRVNRYLFLHLFVRLPCRLGTTRVTAR